MINDKLIHVASTEILIIYDTWQAIKNEVIFMTSIAQSESSKRTKRTRVFIFLLITIFLRKGSVTHISIYDFYSYISRHTNNLLFAKF